MEYLLILLFCFFGERRVWCFGGGVAPGDGAGGDIRRQVM